MSVAVTATATLRAFLCAAAVSVACSAAASAQDFTAVEPHIKAAFLFNFLKFVEWPPDVLAAGPITVCIAGSPAVAGSLKTALKEHRPLDHDVVVAPLAAATPAKGCHLVYVADGHEEIARRWLVALQGSTAFSVSDCERFARLGGVANFFVRDGRLRFAVNVDAVRRAGLHISSRMLALAEIVKDDGSQGDLRTSR